VRGPETAYHEAVGPEEAHEEAVGGVKDEVEGEEVAVSVAPFTDAPEVSKDEDIED